MPEREEFILRLSVDDREALADLRRVSREVAATGRRAEEVTRRETRVLSGQERTVRALREEKARVLRQRRVERGLVEAGIRDLRRESAAVSGLTSTFTALGRGLGLLGGVGAGFAAFRFGREAIDDAREFSRAIAEVATIADATQEELRGLSSEVLDLAVAQGQNETVIARGLYQTLSAGITDAADATNVLREASRLAIAGVSDTASTVDALTSILNAYGLEASAAADVSDLLFATVRAGKTTIDEIAGSIGRVAPSAEAAGLSLEELSAAISTVTLTTGDTGQAATQVVQVLDALKRRADDIGEAFASAGREFRFTDVRTRGLGAVLLDLREVLRDDQTELTKLLGSTEALNGALNLTAESGARFARGLETAADRAGGAGRAFETQLIAPAAALDAQLNALRVGALGLGSAFLEGLAGGVPETVEELQEQLAELRATVENFAPLAEQLGNLFAGIGEEIGPVALLISNTAAALLELRAVAALAFGDIDGEGASQAVESLARIRDISRETARALVEASEESGTATAALGAAFVLSGDALEAGATFEEYTAQLRRGIEVQEFLAEQAGRTSREVLTSSEQIQRGLAGIRAELTELETSDLGFEGAALGLERLQEQLDEIRAIGDLTGFSDADVAALAEIEGRFTALGRAAGEAVAPVASLFAQVDAAFLVEETRLLQQLTGSLQAQTTVVRRAADAERERIGLLEAEGQILPAQADELRRLASQIERERIARLEAAAASREQAGALERLREAAQGAARDLAGSLGEGFARIRAEFEVQPLDVADIDREVREAQSALRDVRIEIAPKFGEIDTGQLANRIATLRAQIGGLFDFGDEAIGAGVSEALAGIVENVRVAGPEIAREVQAATRALDSALAAIAPGGPLVSSEEAVERVRAALERLRDVAGPAGVGIDEALDIPAGTTDRVEGFVSRLREEFTRFGVEVRDSRREIRELGEALLRAEFEIRPVVGDVDVLALRDSLRDLGAELADVFEPSDLGIAEAVEGALQEAARAAGAGTPEAVRAAEQAVSAIREALADVASIDFRGLSGEERAAALREALEELSQVARLSGTEAGLNYSVALAEAIDDPERVVEAARRLLEQIRLSGEEFRVAGEGLAGAFGDGFTSGLPAIEDSFFALGDASRSAFSGLISDAIQGANAIENFKRRVLASFAEIIADQATTQVVQLLAQLFAGTVVGSFFSGAPAASGSSSAAVGAVPPTPTIFAEGGVQAFAQGGLDMFGGAAPKVQKFPTGGFSGAGFSRESTLTVFGDQSRRFKGEAFIPIPADARGIPVDIRPGPGTQIEDGGSGGGNVNVSFNISATDAQSFTRQLAQRESREFIVSAISEAMRRNTNGAGDVVKEIARSS